MGSIETVSSGRIISRLGFPTSVPSDWKPVLRPKVDLPSKNRYETLDWSWPVSPIRNDLLC